MDKGNITTIPLTKETRDTLRLCGKKGETWNALVNRLCVFYVEKGGGQPSD